LADIEICAGGCNDEDGPKDKQDVELFFAEALKEGVGGFRVEPGGWREPTPAGAIGGVGLGRGTAVTLARGEF